MESRLEIDGVALGAVRQALGRLVDDSRALLRRTEEVYAQIETLAKDAVVPINRQQHIVAGPTPIGPAVWRIDEVKKRVGLSRSTIWHLVKENEFPEPRRLTSRTVGWLASDVEAWIASRKRLSDANRAR